MSPETLQTVIVALIVAAAALFVGARLYRAFALARRRRDAGGCGGGCGCSPE